MSHPVTRLRRLRENPRLRAMVRDAKLSKSDLVQPLFVKEGLSRPAAISSMPGQFQHSLQSLTEEAKKLEALGVPAVILFGVPTKKDLSGKAAFSGKGIIQQAVTKIKKSCPKFLVITDICLCEYLSHGHCGLLKKGKRLEERGQREDFKIINDKTVKILAKIALSHARAGADVVAPSDMMDGRVRAIRNILDKNNFQTLPILSYAVKYASAFYSPFREAAESAPGFGDRKTYQMSPSNIREALREAATDLEEGADILMVKPALSYLDVLRQVRDKFNCPVAAYSVSGEYSMIKAASSKGWIDEKKIVLETHLSMKRAGASFILTYWAKDLAGWLRHE